LSTSVSPSSSGLKRCFHPETVTSAGIDALLDRPTLFDETINYLLPKTQKRTTVRPQPSVIAWQIEIIVILESYLEIKINL